MMPTHVALFYALLIVSTATAFFFGGRPERQVAGMLLLATLCSKIAAWPFQGHFLTFEAALCVIDFLLLIGVATVALTSDRYWPVWFTALHAYTVIAHLGRLVVPQTHAAVYFLTSALTVYPGLFVLMAGAARQLIRMKRYAANRRQT